MAIELVIKRNGSIVEFNRTRIEDAIEKACLATNAGVDRQRVVQITDLVLKKLQEKFGNNTPTVEGVQDMVEIALMESDLHATAKAYIIYRQERASLRKRDIFKKRLSLKPYEYPELLEYVDGIRHSYWLHTEFNFTSDIHDYLVNTTEIEKSAIKNAMLAIAQVEVSVKTFWGDVYKKIPKPEVGAVGATFAESEVRHQDAYAHLLEILGFNHEFERIKEVPAIISRINYIEKSIANAHSDHHKDYARTLLLFSLFIEHVSLFSQFLIIMSFNKFKGLFRGMSNVIEATSKEEQIHGLFGIDLLKIIKTEHPEWFTEEYEQSVYDLCNEAFAAEQAIVDWIFEKGEIPFLSKATVLEFIKNRFNNSLSAIGFKKLFTIDEKLLEETEWFNDEIMTTKHLDFFVKRSVNYNKRVESITGDDLF